MSLAMALGLRPGDFVLDGKPDPLPKKGAEPPNQKKNSADVYCGQTAGWIKMVRGMEVGLGPGHIVQDGDPAPIPKKGGRAPQFSALVYCGQTAGWMKLVLGLSLIHISEPTRPY